MTLYKVMWGYSARVSSNKIILILFELYKIYLCTVPFLNV